MFIVKSLNTTVGIYLTWQDLIEDFNPQFGRIQDYTYIHLDTNSIVSWRGVFSAKFAN